MEASVIVNRIRHLMDIQNIKEKELAKKLNISEATMKKKMNGDSKFYVNEIEKIKEIFNLDTEQFANVFFNSNYNQKNIKTKNKNKEEKWGENYD